MPRIPVFPTDEDDEGAPDREGIIERIIRGARSSAERAARPVGIAH